ncbi:hypothetical protein U1Q18_002089, partial [Sarracenia purpurea var. burkii]
IIPEDDGTDGALVAVVQFDALDVSGGHFGYVVRSVSEDLMEHIAVRLDLYLPHHFST